MRYLTNTALALAVIVAVAVAACGVEPASEGGSFVCPGGRCDGFEDGSHAPTAELCEQEVIACTVRAMVLDCDALGAGCMACVAHPSCDLATLGTYMGCLDVGGEPARCALIVTRHGTACLEEYRDCLDAGGFQPQCLPILEAEGCDPYVVEEEPATDACADVVCAAGEACVGGACVAAEEQVPEPME